MRVNTRPGIAALAVLACMSLTVAPESVSALRGHVAHHSASYAGLPIPAPAPPNGPRATKNYTVQYEYNWSGYDQAVGTSTGPYTAIRDYWTVPTVSTGLPGNQSSSDWIGIDGVGSKDLVQVGTDADNIGGTPHYDAWIEILPAAEVVISGVTINPGDKIEGLVEETSLNVWKMRIYDLTTGKSGGRTVTYTSSNGGPAAQTSAEVVHERPCPKTSCPLPSDLDTLTKTTNVTFDPGSYSTATYTPSWKPLLTAASGATVYRMFMRNNAGTSIIASPSAPDSDGDGFTVAYGATVPPPPGSRWVTVSAGGASTCAIGTNGTLWCWGANGAGQLGTGNTASELAPTQVGTGTSWASVAAGNGSTCASRTDGTLWCWGDNTYGELGTGNTTSQLTPTQVGAATSWATVSTLSGPTAGNTCAIRFDGTLWCWGYNGNGQDGTGDTTEQLSPTQVGTGTSWTSVSVGEDFTCATAADDNLWCWGYNGYGQLGTGNTTNQLTPTQVGTGMSWASVSAGNADTCATRTDGTLWCWGYNGNGQLGTGNTTNQLTPTQVGTGTSWATVAAGSGDSTCATRTDGTLWCWGDNGQGELGTGNTTSELTPTQVGTATSWATPSAGSDYYNCATRTDGTLWCWGFNYDGQLGTGDTTNRLTPTQVKLRRLDRCAGSWTFSSASFSADTRHDLGYDGFVWLHRDGTRDHTHEQRRECIHRRGQRLALGSRPNDFAIPGLAGRALSVYSADDAERVWAAVRKALRAAAAAADPARQRRLATVVVGGGGATGVELAGELAEILPEMASGHGLTADRPAVQLVEAGPAILAGSSPQLIGRATKILSDLGVQVRTDAMVAAATEEGFRLKDGQLVEGGVFVWRAG